MKNLVRHIWDLLIDCTDDTYSIEYQGDQISIHLKNMHDNKYVPTNVFCSGLSNAMEFTRSFDLENMEIYIWTIDLWENWFLKYVFDIDLYGGCNIDEAHQELNSLWYQLDDSYLEHFRIKEQIELWNV
jgi:hypothetical protein